MKRQKIPDTKLWLPQPLLYCGPTALSTITGLDYDGEIRPAINWVRGRRPSAGVTGMRNDELVRVLARLGWLASPVPTPLGLFNWGTMIQWEERDPDKVSRLRLPDMLDNAFEYRCARRSDIIVVETTRHYVTVQSNVVVDNYRIDSLIRHPARRQLAKRAWKIVWMKTDMYDAASRALHGEFGRGNGI